MQTKLVLKQPSALKLRFQPGATGPAGTITIGTVATGAPGSSVVITNVGTPENAILDITIPRGDTGLTGDKGWSPILALVADGDRFVVQIADWTGGQGTKPASGSYIGPTGLVSNIASAVDIRGPQGPSGSVTDGNKGDIIVSGAGMVWTVASAVVAPYLKRDGTSTITADIPFSGKKITGLADATAATDALNRQTGDARYRLALDAGWKKVSDINIGTAVATVDVALPSGWKALKIAGVWIPDQIASDNTLGIRFSIDNGASYKAGSTDYIGSTLSQSGSTPGAAGSVSGTYWRAGTATDNATIVCAFQGIVTQSSGSKIPSMLGFSTGYSSGGTTLIYRGGYCNFGGITNIRFLPANGNIGVGTRLVLEVCF